MDVATGDLRPVDVEIPTKRMVGSFNAEVCVQHQQRLSDRAHDRLGKTMPLVPCTWIRQALLVDLFGPRVSASASSLFTYSRTSAVIVSRSVV